MMYLMKAGGWSMWIVLLFGVITLILAGLFVWRPRDSRLGFIRAMSLATVFAVLSGVAADVAATFRNTVHNDAAVASGEWPLYVMTGLSESMSPAILGFSMLGVAWLLTGVGIRRLAADNP